LGFPRGHTFFFKISGGFIGPPFSKFYREEFLRVYTNSFFTQGFVGLVKRREFPYLGKTLFWGIWGKRKGNPV